MEQGDAEKPMSVVGEIKMPSEPDSPSPPAPKSAAPPASLFKSGIAMRDIWNACGSPPPPRDMWGTLPPPKAPQLPIHCHRAAGPLLFASSYTQGPTAVEPSGIVQLSVLTQVPPDLLFLARGRAHCLCTGTSALEAAAPFLPRTPNSGYPQSSHLSANPRHLLPFPHYPI